MLFNDAVGELFLLLPPLLPAPLLGWLASSRCVVLSAWRASSSTRVCSRQGTEGWAEACSKEQLVLQQRPGSPSMTTRCLTGMYGRAVLDCAGRQPHGLLRCPPLPPPLLLMPGTHRAVNDLLSLGGRVICAGLGALGRRLGGTLGRLLRFRLRAVWGGGCGGGASSAPFSHGAASARSPYPAPMRL